LTLFDLTWLTCSHIEFYLSWLPLHDPGQSFLQFPKIV
jgi:hypothetical protein